MKVNFKTLISFIGFILPITIAAQFHIYIGDTGFNNIRRIHADGTNVEEIVEIDTARELEINPYSDKLWFIDNDNGEISRCDLDGTNIEVMVAGLTSPNSIFLDHENDRIIYSSLGTNQIFVANMDGSNPTVIMDGDGAPSHVELECGTNHIYWADYENGRIVKTLDDGSDSEYFLTGLQQPKDLEIDKVNGWVYWIEGGDVNKVRRADLSGQNIEDIFQLSGPFGSIEIDYFNQRLFLLDFFDSRLYSMNLDGTDIETLFSAFSVPGNIAIVSCRPKCSSELVHWCGSQPFVNDQDTLIEADSYDFLYDAVSGCDSLHTVHLTLSNPVEMGLEVEYFIGANDELNLALTADFINVEWNDGTLGNDISIDASELGIGVHEFTVFAENTLHGCELSWTFTITVSDPNNIHFQELNSIKVYPVPVRAGQPFQLEFEANQSGAYTLSAYTSQGRLVRQEQVSSGSHVVIDAPQAAGLYLMTLKSPTSQKAFRIEVLGH